MSSKVYDIADIPGLKPIGPMLDELRRWDTTHKHLVNVEIIILDFETIETQYGESLLANCLVSGEPKAVLLGGMVLCQQLLSLKEQLPLLATIIKTGQYYAFS